MTEYDEEGASPRDIRISEGQYVMPFYLILDQSASMARELPELSTRVSELLERLRNDPVADDLALLSVISFGSSARVTVPLDRLSAIQPLGRLNELGGTSFSTAWQTYDQAVRADYAAIKAKGAKMHRPCVFFLTDGEPQDDAIGENGRMAFRQVFDSLQGEHAIRYWPYVVALGFREAPQAALEQLAYPDFGDKRGRWFNLRDSNIDAVLRAIENMIYGTVISSTATASRAEGPELVLEEPEPAANIDSGHAAVDQGF